MVKSCKVGIFSLVIITLFCLNVINAFGDWQVVERASGEEELSLRFALKQYNLDVLEKTLLDVSNPKSENYGQWWTRSQILDLVAPRKESSEFVVSFLSLNGATEIENRRDVIICKMQVQKIENIFKTSMFLFAHTNGRSYVTRSKNVYTMPREIADHVELISGLLEFPEPRVPSVRSSNEGDEVGAVSYGYLTVSHIQELYNVPASFNNHPNSSIALIEFQNDNSYSQSDLNLFVQEMAIPNFTVNHVIGHYNGTAPDGESSLDVQYGGAIAINADVWFWTEKDWLYEFVTDLQNTPNPPLVVSMSWGLPEPMQCIADPDQCNDTSTTNSIEYVNRMNVEFMKVGMMGITLVAASGDQGAPGDSNYDCTNQTDPFSTIFPGASPWVLSVGATMLYSFFPDGADVEPQVSSSDPPICKKWFCSTKTKEMACSYPDALITTGGGFSNVSPRPSYQDSAVNHYFSAHTKFPPSGYYNKSNRGFPDVSAVGHNYLIATDGQFGGVDGTSCSAPVVAGIITLLNSARLNANKAPLGFIVPLVYEAYAADSSTFKDIVKGDNKCTETCCVWQAYETTEGWDPVTGLGTPQFPQLLKYVNSLP